ncbi:hypothetical protein AVEN_143251-1 [Araneus ventricosus]|uniref:Uncharacterized protein n=1 Tax=Araneus ventricosus TaxID=182803 RepID=A0A4Y2AE88_ARAVE|nr:hypothetical protein AVEN_143251-1 [Araneus ventricosus]
MRLPPPYNVYEERENPSQQRLHNAGADCVHHSPQRQMNDLFHKKLDSTSPREKGPIGALLNPLIPVLCPLVGHSNELTLLQDYSAHVTPESHCCRPVMDVCLSAKTVIFRCPGYYRRQRAPFGVSRRKLRLHSEVERN